MPYNSPLLITLTIVYGVISAITTLDIRINQAKKGGVLLPSETQLPNWVVALYWLEWVLFILMLILNWKYALIVFTIRFVLKVLPVLEIIGNIIMGPFRRK